MDILGTENRETAITLLNEDQAAHRYEDIPIAATLEKEKTTKHLKNLATASKLESKSSKCLPARFFETLVCKSRHTNVLKMRAGRRF